MITDELWAVLDDQGFVMSTKGGSSTPKKLMVYASHKKAMNGLSVAEKRIGMPLRVSIICVYKRQE